MNKQIRTITLQEYGPMTPLHHVAEALCMTVTDLETHLSKLVRQVKTNIGTETFIERSGNSFRFVKIAGIIGLSNHQWIEVVPKFLRANSPQWREDFLWLSAQTQFGSLFRNYLLPVATHKDSNLFEIITQTWLDHFEANQRAMIRNYNQSLWCDFAIDGDVDEEDLCNPTSHGFLQAGLLLSGGNSYNLLMMEASSHLRANVSNQESLLRLDRANMKLRLEMAGGKPKRAPTGVISRHRRWEPLLELSKIVVATKSFGYNGSGEGALPGYILRTHDAWEFLVRSACRRAFPRVSVTKKFYPLGYRHSSDRRKQVKVTPDVTIGGMSGPVLLVDAKYKSSRDSSTPSQGKAVIDSQDIYESLAFMRASASNVIHLVYPDDRLVVDPSTLGQPLEVVTVAEEKIVAASLGVGGISRRDGFRRFCDNLRVVIALDSVSL